LIDQDLINCAPGAQSGGFLGVTSSEKEGWSTLVITHQVTQFFGHGRLLAELSLAVNNFSWLV
jgi:hypothetical protein